MAAYTVVFDACVLYPAPLRDILVQLATVNLFRARWTERIHDEWIRSLLKSRPDIPVEKLARTKQRMNDAVLDCLILNYEYLIPTIELPDLDDRHVLAAAIHARADAVITFNLRDFPEAELARHNLEPLHPDDFINFQMDLDEARVVAAVKTCRARLKNPEKSAAEYLDILIANQLPKTVTRLRGYEELI